ncbi:MAG TPA: aldehyde dehydrogenase EutE [Thermoanaerobaculales bacterium]|nr:aldehyde dehydrogenase EutE [Thermoanaerobaculales bacterium]
MKRPDVDAVVARVMAELRQGQSGRHGPRPDARTEAAERPPQPAAAPRHGSSLFDEVDAAVEAAQQAHRRLRDLPLEVRERMIAHIRRAMRANAQPLAYESWGETGMGRYEDKIEKILLNANKAPGTELLSTGAWSGDGGLTVVEYAPYGVIGSIVPSTNPVSTVVCNSLSMVAAGNAVVFNAHPGARGCSNRAVELVNDAIVEAGGPADLVCAVAQPTIGTAQQIMGHGGVNLLVVTGGAAVVQAAMASGKRAICAGPGNPPVVVDETADVRQAGRDIVRGASFDNNIICTDEKEVFAVAAIADELVAQMCAHGAVRIDGGQLERLRGSIFAEPPRRGERGRMNPAFIGKNANRLLAEIGVEAGDEVRLVVVEVERDDPLVLTEQMMPVLPVVRVRDADEGIDLARAAERGCRHTAVMHSKNLDHLSRMAREMDCSIFVKNGVSYDGLGHGGEGYCSFTIASPTGEGLTSPVSFSRVRRCVLKDSFRIV